MAFEEGLTFLEESKDAVAASQGRARSRRLILAWGRGYTAHLTAISAVLIAQNEERHIADALASVSFCDEIVLVDSGSTDRTRDIAKASGARVVVNAPWPGFVAQRDFAVRAAKHDWVLALDADERVSQALREEIEALRRTGFARAGYRIRESPTTSVAGYGAPIGTRTGKCAASTALTRAGRAISSTSPLPFTDR